MLTIAICDDEQAELSYLSLLAKQWAGERPLCVHTYKSAEAFLFHREDTTPPDILLLDIQMGQMDGMALAKRLRAEGAEMPIVFVTGIPDYIGEGYEVAALHYLIKPVSEEKLFAVLTRAAEKLAEAPRSIIFPGENLRIAAGDILYGEVFSHTVTLHLKKGEETLPMRMGDLERLLGEGFFRCHRSYLVNMAHVRRVTRTAMVLQGGRELPLARGLFEKANQAFIKETTRG